MGFWRKNLPSPDLLLAQIIHFSHKFRSKYCWPVGFTLLKQFLTPRKYLRSRLRYDTSTVKINCPWEVILSRSVSRSWPVPLSYDDDLLLPLYWEGYWKVLGVLWLIPSNFLCLFQTTFAESLTGREWFIGTAGISVVCCHPFTATPTATPPRTPSIPPSNTLNYCIKASIGLSYPTLLYPPLLHSDVPSSLHPSSSFSIKESCMGSSYLLLWICKCLLSARQTLGKMATGAPCTA